MKIEEAVDKIFEGCDPSRINLIIRVFRKEDIDMIEDLKFLDSDAWESLSGMTDDELNKIKKFLENEMFIEEAVANALKGAHVSKMKFFEEVLKENLDIKDLKHLDHKYIADSLKILTKAEITEIKKIAEMKLKRKFKENIHKILSIYEIPDYFGYDNDDDSLKIAFLHNSLRMCTIDFDLLEALKRFSDDEIHRIRMFGNGNLMRIEKVVKMIFEGFDASRITFIASVLKEHGVNNVLDLDQFNLKLLETCGKLSVSESKRIKRFVKKRQEMTFEECLVEVIGDHEDVRIQSLAGVSTKFHDVHMAKDLSDLFMFTTTTDHFEDFTYDEIIKLKKCVKETLEESVAEALKDSGTLRISFILKALLGQGLNGAYEFICVGDEEKGGSIYANPLNVLQVLSETEISGIMGYYHKNLREVIGEILEGCDGSRIDFVTKILNKNGIQRPKYLIEKNYKLKLENIEELSDDEVNKIKAFITERKETSIEEELRKILGITDANRISFIAGLMRAENIRRSHQLLWNDWKFFEILMGLRFREVKDIVDFIQKNLEMTIDKAITKIFEGWDPLRINLITRTLKKENIHRIEDLHSLDSNAWEVLRGLTDGEVNKIKEFIRKDCTNSQKRNFKILGLSDLHFYSPSAKQRNVLESLSGESYSVESSESEEESCEIRIEHKLETVEDKLETVEHELETIEHKLDDVIKENIQIKEMLKNLELFISNHPLLKLKNIVVEKEQSNIIQEPPSNSFFQIIATEKSQTTDVNYTLNDLFEMVENPMVPIHKPKNDEVRLPINELLPIKAIEEFHSVDEKLNESDDFYMSLVKKLSLCGESNVKEVIYRILKSLLTHKLSLNISWSGKGYRNLGFQGSKLMKAVMDAVRMNNVTSSASDAECESHMKSWFRNAPDRYGGRNRRRQGKMS